MTSPALRDAARPDSASLAALHALAFPPAQAWSAEALARLFGLPGVFGAIEEAAGFGLARVAFDEAEILTLAVVPARRRQGVGGRILAALLAGAAARGAAAMFLEVAAGNTGGRALYAAAGFAEVGRRRAYYEDGADALVLRRALP